MDRFILGIYHSVHVSGAKRLKENVASKKLSCSNLTDFAVTLNILVFNMKST